MSRMMNEQICPESEAERKKMMEKSELKQRKREEEKKNEHQLFVIMFTINKNRCFLPFAFLFLLLIDNLRE